jgi:hypothetical protein
MSDGDGKKMRQKNKCLGHKYLNNEKNTAKCGKIDTGL